MILKELDKQEEIAFVLERAEKALKELESFSQLQVDRIVKAIARAVHENAEMLAEEAVAETGMGNVADKIIKNRTKSELIYHSLRYEKTVGIIEDNPVQGLMTIAEPVGIVAAIIPCTNPTVTAMSNAMFCIKTRNPIIIAPHPRSKHVTAHTVKLIQEACKPLGLPSGAIQILMDASREDIQTLMHNSNYILATGGSGMVKAAYSSGKPSLGVGAGNVPCVIHSSANIEQSVSDIIRSKTFDNGLICASEQAVIVTRDISGQVWDEFKRQGAFVTNVREKLLLQQAAFGDDGHVLPNVIGQSAVKIARFAGISLPEHVDIKLFLVPTEGIGSEYPFSSEKMSPILAFYITPDFERSIEFASRLLHFQGAGHTASIHTNDRESALQFAHKMKASRVLVNQPAATSSGGARHNRLTPTTTLGCGSWGGNITSDNITAHHLINKKRVAFRVRVPIETENIFSDAEAPSSETLHQTQPASL